MITCNVCNSENLDGTHFCEDCGSPLPQPVAAPPAPTPPAPPAPVAEQAPPEPAPSPSQELPPIAQDSLEESLPSIAPSQEVELTREQPIESVPPAPPMEQAPSAPPVEQAPPAPPGPKVCATCGATNAPNSRFCEDCGASLESVANAPSLNISQPPQLSMSTSSEAPVPPMAQPSMTQPSAPQAPMVQAPVAQGWKFRSLANHQEFVIPKEGGLVGRKSPVDQIYPVLDLTHLDTDSYVSRKHGTFSLQNETLYYEDLGSSNGSFHNQQRLAPKTQVALKRGDILRLGKVELIVE